MSIKNIDSIYPWPAEKIVIDRNALEQCGDFICKKSWRKIMLVADENSFAAAGDQLIKYLSGDIEKKIYKKLLVSSEEAKALSETIKSKNPDIILALGSGSISDLCKYSSFLAQKPYIVVGTAPSMNGYISQNASLWHQGLKSTFNAHGPTALFFDIKILAKAPSRLIGSGFADLMCFSTCYLDWFLSHKVLQTKFIENAFSDLRPLQHFLLKNVDAIKTRNETAIANLTLALLISGNSMVIAQGSYPASQGEHLIAHTYEMINPHDSISHLHGESIGITTLHMIELQENFIKKYSAPKIRYISEGQAKKMLSAHFSDSLSNSCYAEYGKKLKNTESVAVAQKRLEDNWQNIIAAWQKENLSHEDLKNSLNKLEMPTKPSDLGWNEKKFSVACRLAPLIRSRFTFLDLA